MRQTSAKKKRNTRPEQWWQRIITEQRRSGESVDGLCRRQGVSASAFYRWQQRLALQKQPSFTEVEVGLVNECEVRCLSGRAVVVRGVVAKVILASVLAVAEGEA